MRSSFDIDPHPGRPRILFVGFGESTHTHSWIDLLRNASLNARLFALPTLTPPPAEWPVRTYITGVSSGGLDREFRKAFNPTGRAGWALRHVRSALGGGYDRVVARWLARVVRGWRPQIVQTLGLDWAGFLYSEARDLLPTSLRPLWIAQVRGGPDLVLKRFVPELEPKIRRVLDQCDYLIADNQKNYDIATSMGLKPQKVASIGTVPGTGGVQIPDEEDWSPPSRRERIIAWPKAYDCPQSSALTVLEGIRLAWSEIQPARLHLMATSCDVKMWLGALPPAIRGACVAHDRVPRQTLLHLMTRARVMLAPSVSDGVPNTLYEAMASGALPVVSPLETIRAVVRDGENVLFARNLYPEEVAGALVTAMTDDRLVDHCAAANLAKVRELADRAAIGSRVVLFYEELAAETRGAGT